MRLRLIRGGFGDPMLAEDIATRTLDSNKIRSQLGMATLARPDLQPRVAAWDASLSALLKSATTDESSVQEAKWMTLLDESDSIFAAAGQRVTPSKKSGDIRFENEYVTGRYPPPTALASMAPVGAAIPAIGGALLGALVGGLAFGRRGDRVVPALAGAGAGALVGALLSFAVDGKWTT